MKIGRKISKRNKKKMKGNEITGHWKIGQSKWNWKIDQFQTESNRTEQNRTVNTPRIRHNCTKNSKQQTTMKRVVPGCNLLFRCNTKEQQYNSNRATTIQYDFINIQYNTKYIFLAYKHTREKWKQETKTKLKPIVSRKSLHVLKIWRKQKSKKKRYIYKQKENAKRQRPQNTDKQTYKKKLYTYIHTFILYTYTRTDNEASPTTHQIFSVFRTTSLKKYSTLFSIVSIVLLKYITWEKWNETNKNTYFGMYFEK